MKTKETKTNNPLRCLYLLVS